MEITIFGTGCAKCETLARNAGQAAAELGIDYTLIKVSDMQEIVSRGVMMTPAMAVDGKIMVMGRVPTVDGICDLIRKATAK
ncbi:MAG: thioredoxin family protein [Candidatus Wallbacteria bacterium HGW-Wallbacteria-1]|jgi:small redox-active disulfide protein 2|uniref:Thioredoxin family protein n=1 Tax=Candidatus Wallbacteria bacterium HGW-Wallbacteria-1 TaxID=2013854 RepID=A0A2N1PL95_9BACT|nr:MAG: thioredoxin family protein [Candidatus Wallbacteria bacterium HGW-Wallbacteria-1]